MKSGWFVWFVLVAPVFGQEVADDIRGPKPLVVIPDVPEPTPWLVYLAVAVVVLLVGALLVWALTRKKKVVASAEEKAVRELSDLEKNGADLEAGDFALAASGIVRTFIARKFGLAAPKRTTEEFLQELASGENESLRSRMEPLRGFLKACDMAKFAGTNLAGAERGDLVAKARTFVEAPVENELTMKEVA